MVAIPRATRKLVRTRAIGRCEYCRIPEEEFAAATSFVVEHIQPRSLFRNNDPLGHAPQNLAWSCPKCNLHKATKTQATDPETGQIFALFNPRRDQWEDHFYALLGGRIEGKTPSGRATREALKFNEPDRVLGRYHLAQRKRWP